MIDAHTHDADSEDGCNIVSGTGEILKRFFGIHPWNADNADVSRVEKLISQNPCAGVGEIGLDRLHTKVVGDVQRQIFRAQLEIASKYNRPAVLHGAKCWGEVVKIAKPFAGRIPAFLFHGFSRSAGLLPDIRAMNGFISVGPAILNDHAANYRSLAAQIPEEMLLLETDGKDSSISDICAMLASIRNTSAGRIEELADGNALRFISAGAAA